MTATLVALLLTAEPDPCLHLTRLEAQLAAIRAPLPEADRTYTQEQAELQLRALVIVEVSALDELKKAKQQGRERLVAFQQTLAKDSELYEGIAQGTLPVLDRQLEQVEHMKQVYSPKRVAEAKHRLAKHQLEGWETIFGGDQQASSDVHTLVRHGPWQDGLEPVIGWFGLAYTSLDVQCAPGKTATVALFESGQVAADVGWRDLAATLDLQAIARLTAKVKTVHSTLLEIGCGPTRKKPKLRYDAATRTVDYDSVSKKQCLGEKIASQLSINMPDHGFASGNRTPLPVIPAAEWNALAERLSEP